MTAIPRQKRKDRTQPKTAGEWERHGKESWTHRMIDVPGGWDRILGHKFGFTVMVVTVIR